MRTYRTRFLLALAGNIVLAAILAGFWLHSRGTWLANWNGLRTVAGPTASSSTEVSADAPPPPADTPLAPMQISAQRLQSIGVKTGLVERRPVEDEIRATGNVAVDETRVAYVQVRFPGYI